MLIVYELGTWNYELVTNKLEVRVAFLSGDGATNGLGIGGGESKPALTYPCARTYLPMLNIETSFPLHVAYNQELFWLK